MAWKNCWRLLISNTSVSPPFHPSSLFFPRCWVDSNAGEYKYHLLFTRDFHRAKEGASFPSGSLIQFFFYFTLPYLRSMEKEVALENNVISFRTNLESGRETRITKLHDESYGTRILEFQNFR